MKIQTFNTKEEWLASRVGKITGSRLGDLVAKRGNGYKMGYYELIAERIALPHNGENVMDRGIRLEEEACLRFEKETGKKVNNDLVIWTRDDNEDIAISPDGMIGKIEAIEVKCLSSALHIKAWLTKEIPSEYEEQIIQYFVVNDSLKKLHFVFYDPRMPKDFFYFTVERSEVKEKIEEYLELQKRILKEIDEIEKQFTF